MRARIQFSSLTLSQTGDLAKNDRSAAGAQLRHSRRPAAAAIPTATASESTRSTARSTVTYAQMRQSAPVHAWCASRAISNPETSVTNRTSSAKSHAVTRLRFVMSDASLLNLRMICKLSIASSSTVVNKKNADDRSRPQNCADFFRKYPLSQTCTPTSAPCTRSAGTSCRRCRPQGQTSTGAARAHTARQTFCFRRCR